MLLDIAHGVLAQIVTGAAMLLRLIAFAATFLGPSIFLGRFWQQMGERDARIAIESGTAPVTLPGGVLFRRALIILCLLIAGWVLGSIAFPGPWSRN